MWLSSANVSATLHYDTEHNVLVQLVGRKRVTLFPPSQHKRLYLHSALHPSWRQCMCRSCVPLSLSRFVVVTCCSGRQRCADQGVHASHHTARIARADSRLLNKFPFYDNVTAFQVSGCPKCCCCYCCHYAMQLMPTCAQVELEPGQVLYMPPFWFHHVTALTPSVSLNVWSTSRAGVLSEAVQDVALPFDARFHPLPSPHTPHSLLLHQ